MFDSGTDSEDEMAHRTPDRREVARWLARLALQGDTVDYACLYEAQGHRDRLSAWCSVLRDATGVDLDATLAAAREAMDAGDDEASVVAEAVAYVRDELRAAIVREVADLD